MTLLSGIVRCNVKWDILLLEKHLMKIPHENSLKISRSKVGNIITLRKENSC